MASHLPTEITIEILARLPVKSLLRFTLACKLWYSIITNPNFITTHLNRSGERNADQLFLRLWSHDSRQELYFLLPDQGKIDKNPMELSFEMGCTSGRFDLVGSCNGLVFLHSDYKQCVESVIIWNPSLRKSITLTLPDKPQDHYTSVVGFGFVSGKSEFKVVRITYTERRLDQRGEVKVYEQGGEREWRKIKCAPPDCKGFMCSQVFLHESVHWLAHDHQNQIVVFDMANEVFKVISLPDGLADTRMLSITLFKGSLAVVYENIYTVSETRRQFLAWEMRDYGVLESWTTIYNIILPQRIQMMLGFRKSGEILFMTNRGAVVSYDSKTNTITNISIKASTSFMTMHNYVGSLVLLKGKK